MSYFLYILRSLEDGSFLLWQKEDAAGRKQVSVRDNKGKSLEHPGAIAIGDLSWWLF